jgi:hypothetical protein
MGYEVLLSYQERENPCTALSLFSRELKLLRGAHLGGRFLKLLGDTRIEDLDSEVVELNRRYLGTAVVDVRDFYH